MKSTSHSAVLLIALALAAPAFAQDNPPAVLAPVPPPFPVPPPLPVAAVDAAPDAAGDAADTARITDPDHVSESYQQELRGSGIIRHAMQSNDMILFFEQERVKAAAIKQLIDVLGPDAKITMPNGEIFDLSQTEAARDARIDAMQKEQSVIAQKLALTSKQIEAEVMTDPAITEAMRIALTNDLASGLVDKLGAGFKIIMADGREIDLAETTAGKRRQVEELKAETDLLKAQAELAAQANAVLKAEIDRETIAASGAIERERLERQATVARQTEAAGSAAAAPQIAVSVTQIFGEGSQLRAAMLINDRPIEVSIGDILQGGGQVKRIDRTSVILEINGQERPFYVY